MRWLTGRRGTADPIRLHVSLNRRSADKKLEDANYNQDCRPTLLEVHDMVFLEQKQDAYRNQYGCTHEPSCSASWAAAMFVFHVYAHVFSFMSAARCVCRQSIHPAQSAPMAIACQHEPAHSVTTGK